MATALPSRTAANDALIANTPYAQLTDRQKQYAAVNGITLQQPIAAPAPAAPVGPTFTGTSGGTDPYGLGLGTQAAASGYGGSYNIGGTNYYFEQQQQYAGGAGINGAQQVLAAWLSDPNASEQTRQWARQQYASGAFDTYNNTNKQGEAFNRANDPQFGGGGAGDAGGGGPGGPGGPGGMGAANAPGSAAALAKDSSNRDALAQINKVLGDYGLEGLADFAWREIVNGRSGNEILQDIRETPQFNERFPAIKARTKAGLPALSPGEYVSYEKNATEYMRAAGLPKGFYDDKTDFTKFLTNDVSLNELGQRIDMAKQAAYQAPTELRQALRGKFGLGDGDLAAFFLDPDKAQPLLQRTYNAAAIAGAGTRTGYDTSADQDYRLADLGVSADQAQAGFGQLGHDKELFSALTGHSNEGAISTDTQLAAQFGGNSNATDQVESRRRQRQAEFRDGGQFAETQGGITGLGSAGSR